MSKLFLALDLSSPKGSFCAFESSDDPRLIFERELPGTFTHSETLLTELQSLLSSNGLSISDVSKWVTTSGPGSFTGLRIAYATLKAFSLATSKPIVTIEGPEARARAFFEEASESKNLPIDVLSYLTADKFVVSSFEFADNQLKKISEKTHQGAVFPGQPNRTVLAEERVGSGILFPLRASHLRFFVSLSSQKEHLPSELSELSPLYFGSSHFD